MIENRLFRLAVEDIALNAHCEPGQGWSLRVAKRRQGEPWGDTPWEEYSKLSNAELLDVVLAELSRLA